ncbi:MAG: helix-turn-helix domain-containing protein, partial [Opitutaceae bacterium]
HLAAAPVDGNVVRDGGILRPDFVFPESGFSMEAASDEIVLRAVRQANDNVSGAARLLGVSRDVVRYRLKAVRPDNSSGGNSPTEEG